LARLVGAKALRADQLRAFAGEQTGKAGERLRGNRVQWSVASVAFLAMLATRLL